MAPKVQTVSDKKKNQMQQKQSKLKKNKPDPESDDEEEIEDSEYETDTSDSSYKPVTRSSKKNAAKSKKPVKSKKATKAEDEEEEDEEDETDELNSDQFVNRSALQKLLSAIFPSKNVQSSLESKIMDGIDQSLKGGKSKTSAKSKKPVQKSKRSRVIEDDESNESDEDEDEDEDESNEDEDDSNESDEYEEEWVDDDEEDQKGFYNIVFSMDGEGDEDEYLEDDDDVEIDEDDEEAFMKEKYVKSSENDTPTKSKKSSKVIEDDDDVTVDVEQEYLDLVETKKTLTNQLKKKPGSKILKNAVKECEGSIKNLIKEARSKNAKTYHSLIHGDKKRTNEIDYFKKKLSNKEQLRVMKDLKEINSFINIEKPYRLALLDSHMPPKFKAVALQKLNVLRSMDPGDNEYYKIKNWVDTFMKIPFGKYQNLTVTMEDGIDRCQEFMESAKAQLDSCVYGLEDAKMQIMQMIGQWIANPAAMGSAIAIKGPPGTGKTSLVKEGISKIMGREFTFIALGGTGDASFLEGHSYTYEGSTWGKIVQILIDSKCMNPVIYFDELDKISDTARGQEIVGILTHLTDTSQNSQFHDKYFSEVDFDLSKCLFIFSYNDENNVNPILRDRMYRIQTKGYDSKEKSVIARNYLLPKIREQVNFADGDIIIPDETVQYIVSNSALTGQESGVRNLKRCLEIIYTKLNLFRLLKPDAKLLGKDVDLQVTFPFTVTKKEVDILIKNEEKQNQSMLAMYC
jgi:ATP-dependent Lon protease